MKIHIEVTQNDINDGVREDCYGCPIALAMRRVLRFPAGVDCGAVKLDTGRRDRFRFVDLPEDAEDFISDFDGDEGVSPFAFDLDIPDDIPLKEQP